MPASKSTATEIARNRLAIAGAKSHAAELPKEAGAARGQLEKLHLEIQELDDSQEKAKKELAKTTKQLGTAILAATVQRGKIVRLAEATFGPKAVEMREFRPTTQGKVIARKPKTK